MLLVGEVRGRTAILVDDLADTSNTITRAAKLLKKEGAQTVYALLSCASFSFSLSSLFDEKFSYFFSSLVSFCSIISPFFSFLDENFYCLLIYLCLFLFFFLLFSLISPFFYFR
jgi:hypothetical protein